LGTMNSIWVEWHWRCQFYVNGFNLWTQVCGRVDLKFTCEKTMIWWDCINEGNHMTPLRYAHWTKLVGLWILDMCSLDSNLGQMTTNFECMKLKMGIQTWGDII
jgi:hypothetical protein